MKIDLNIGFLKNVYNTIYLSVHHSKAKKERLDEIVSGLAKDLNHFDVELTPRALNEIKVRLCKISQKNLKAVENDVENIPMSFLSPQSLEQTIQRVKETLDELALNISIDNAGFEANILKIERRPLKLEERESARSKANESADFKKKELLFFATRDVEFFENNPDLKFIKKMLDHELVQALAQQIDADMESPGLNMRSLVIKIMFDYRSKMEEFFEAEGMDRYGVDEQADFMTAVFLRQNHPLFKDALEELFNEMEEKHGTDGSNEMLEINKFITSWYVAASGTSFSADGKEI